jgi:hypothetical protein
MSKGKVNIMAFDNAKITATTTGKTTNGQAVTVEPQVEAIYNLEFCIWLHANFDHILAYLPQWVGESTGKARVASSRNFLRFEFGLP